MSSSVQTKSTGKSYLTFPVVVYQCAINGKAYQNQTTKAGEQLMSIRLVGEAESTVARYSVGARVMVYYNPPTLPNPRWRDNSVL